MCQMVTSVTCCHLGHPNLTCLPLPCSRCLLAPSAWHFQSCVISFHVCGSNETSLPLLGFTVIQVMRWGGPGQTVTSSSSTQVIFISRLRSQLGHPSCTTCKPDTHCPTPLPSFFWLFFCCYPYQGKNLTNLAYPSDVRSRLRCDSVENSCSVFTYKHSQWTRRQRKGYMVHHGDCKTLRSQQIERSLTELPIPHSNALFLFWFEQPQVCKTSEIH